MVLRGTGVAVALPFLEATCGRRARAAAPRKRVLFWFTPCGHVQNVFGNDAWSPVGGSETGWSLKGTNHQPLEAFRDDLLFVDGLDNKAAMDHRPEPGHLGGAGAILTGTALIPGNLDSRGYREISTHGSGAK